MAKLLIVVYHRFELWNAPAWFAERLRAEFPQLEVQQLPSYTGIEDAIKDAEIYLGWSLSPAQFRSARRLRWIHSPAAAVHQLMHPDIVASQVTVTNASAVHGPVVAEHALALMLALARRLPSALRYQHERQWGQQRMWREQPPPRELRDSTLLLVGYGSIGSQAARLALALGMRVLVVREHPEQGSGQTAGAIEVHGFAQLDHLLPRADFVLLAAPLTEKTHNLFSAERLERLRPDAYLLNVARGPLVEEAALAAALRAGKLAGAALDVFSAEPLPAESPLWDAPNLLITPHSAALTERLWERHYQLFSENLRRYFAGQPLVCQVDKRKGY